jgi:hypothetical protein
MNDRIEMFEEFDSGEVLIATILVGNPLTGLPAVIEVKA